MYSVVLATMLATGATTSEWRFLRGNSSCCGCTGSSAYVANGIYSQYGGYYANSAYGYGYNPYSSYGYNGYNQNTAGGYYYNGSYVPYGTYNQQPGYGYANPTGPVGVRVQVSSPIVKVQVGNNVQRSPYGYSLTQAEIDALRAMIRVPVQNGYYPYNGNGYYPPNTGYPANGYYPNAGYPANGYYPPNAGYPANGSYPPNAAYPPGVVPPSAVVPTPIQGFSQAEVEAIRGVLQSAAQPTIPQPPVQGLSQAEIDAIRALTQQPAAPIPAQAQPAPAFAPLPGQSLSPAEVDALRNLLQAPTNLQQLPGQSLSSNDITALRALLAKGTKDATPFNTKALPAAPGKVTVTLPANARLWVDHVEAQRGPAVRTISTPPLLANQKYFYDLTAQFVRNGQSVTETQRVLVTAGQEARADFTGAPRSPLASR